MVTELFDPIPRTMVPGITTSTASISPLIPNYSSAIAAPVVTTIIPISTNQENKPFDKVSTVPSLTAPIIVSTTESPLTSILQSAPKYHQDSLSSHADNATALSKNPQEPVHSLISSAQPLQQVDQHSGNISRQQAGKPNEHFAQDAARMIQQDKSQEVMQGQGNLADMKENVDYLTNILACCNDVTYDNQMNNPTPASIDSSDLADIKFEPMDTMYGEAYQGSAMNSFEVCKGVDGSEFQKGGGKEYCPWESGSSSSSASSIGSHFEFSCSQDFSDMMSDFGVSDIDWGTVDMIKI